MTKKIKVILCWLSCMICSFFITANSLHAESSQTAAAPIDVRLYILNCGYIDMRDGSSFSDTNLYPHQPLHLADPCFLIKNPKGWLLWDLGLGDQYINHKLEDTKHGFTFTVPVSLTAQLKQLGLTPKDIQYVAISHAHLDHTGNANLFTQATWLVQQAEYQFIQQKPLPFSVANNFFQILSGAHKILLDGDYDVFGDGTVQILRTPGHTPGHQSLEIVLPHQGVVILSGDLYHMRKSYLLKQVPVFNNSRADTLASMARIDGILHNTHGRLIIQHDPNDFAALPKIPKYLN